jgi:hypothetical protein
VIHTGSNRGFGGAGRYNTASDIRMTNKTKSSIKAVAVLMKSFFIRLKKE